MLPFRPKPRNDTDSVENDGKNDRNDDNNDDNNTEKNNSNNEGDDAKSKTQNHRLLPRPREDTASRIFRLTPVPTIVLDATLRIIEVSDSHAALVHCARDEILNMSVYEVPPNTIVAPDTATLSSALQAALSTRARQVMDQIQLSDCSAIYRLHLTPIFDGANLVSVVLEAVAIHGKGDVEKDETPNPLPVNSQHHYLNQACNILVDNVKDYAIFMLDSGGHIATWNSGASILKGYAASEIIGKHFSIFYSEEDRRLDKPARELVICLRDGRVEDEGWRYRKDGSRFWANVMITPIYKDHHHVGFVKITRDLTERKDAEARLVSAFEQSAKLKSEFLANISHEIRTPMNGLFLALAMLTDTELTDQQRELTSVIEGSTSLLLQVINDILDYSKLSSNSFTLTTEVFDVSAVFAAVISNCKSSLKPGVQLESQIAPEMPRHVRGDPLRYRQVLQNLVSNAIKFTEGGSIRISITAALDGDDPSKWAIHTEVIDTGIGVPVEAVSTLFTPFTRFADSSFKRYQGTGLGLSICKSLAELMDGSVGFRPNPDGRGSIFWVTVQMGSIDMPTAEVPSPQLVVDKAHKASEELCRRASQKQILLVEDNMVSQMVMLKLLKNLGFERVDTAWDGAEAVRLVKQKPLSYNVVLMDINMPVLDGIEATKQIRSLHIDVPIIAITGNALNGDAEVYLASGMDDYLAKPVHRQQLVRTLLKWLES